VQRCLRFRIHVWLGTRSRTISAPASNGSTPPIVPRERDVRRAGQQKSPTLPLD
jgi:hypothetical protein